MTAIQLLTWQQKRMTKILLKNPPLIARTFMHEMVLSPGHLCMIWCYMRKYMVCLVVIEPKLCVQQRTFNACGAMFE